MSGAAVDVSCVIFHEKCPGLGATLYGGELFVVVVVVVAVFAAVVIIVRSEGCVLFTSSCRDHVEVQHYGGRYRWVDTSPT
jgi:hypothetical protein